MAIALPFQFMGTKLFLLVWFTEFGGMTTIDAQFITPAQFAQCFR